MSSNNTLNSNVKRYVNGYISAKNSGNQNTIAPLNSNMIRNLKRFINNKRAGAAGAAVAAVQNAGANKIVALGAGQAVLSSTPSSSVENVGKMAARLTNQKGGNSRQNVVAAYNAAFQHAVSIGHPPPVAAQEANKVASEVALNIVPNIKKASNLVSNATGKSPNRINMNFLNSIGNNPTNKQLSTVRRILSDPFSSNNLKARAKSILGPTRGESLLRQAQEPESHPINTRLYKTIKAPNGRNVMLMRANNSARWNFKNNYNSKKYNLNNRLSNNPTIREAVNLSESNLFR